jgi:putative endonuclease
VSYFVYILKSQKTNTHYYGSTADINMRLKVHNEGKVRYTKSRRPWVLHYYEEFATRSEAVKREYFFKTIDGYNFLKQKKII